jgi:hypothetical protein
VWGGGWTSPGSRWVYLVRARRWARDTCICICRWIHASALQQCRQLKTGGDEAVRMLVDSASHTATREGEARAALARAKERVAALQQAREE